MAEVIVIPEGFVFLSLVGFVEMATAGFLASFGIEDHQFGKLEEIGHASSPFQALVEIIRFLRGPVRFPRIRCEVPGSSLLPWRVLHCCGTYRNSPT